MIDTYILAEDGQTPVPEADINKWGMWFENRANRILAQDRFGEVLISTVFLGLDHNFLHHGRPTLWETMIFGCPELEGYQERYSSYWEAVGGHQRALGKYFKSVKE